MSNTDYSTMSKEEFRREFVRALDDLVESGRYHVQRINEGLARTDELFRQRAREARETRPPYNGTVDRFDRIDQALESLRREVTGLKGEVTGLKGEVTGLKDEVTGVKREVADIRERMATKVELESMGEDVKRMADGYTTTQQRLDRVADMLKTHVIVR